jgi:hypothetical protein
MTSSPSKPQTDRPERRMPKALAWLLIAIAAFPFPWWW